MKEKLVEEKDVSVNVGYTDKQETSATQPSLTKYLEKSGNGAPKMKLY